MTKMSTRRAQARDTLIPAACAVAAAGTALEEWRYEAGPKKKWSNHVRLEEAGLFGEFKRAAAALSKTMTACIPAHWSMDDWAFKPARMGDKMRWAARGGRAQGGVHLQTLEPYLLEKIGLLAGLATHGGAPTATEARRMKVLGLSSRDHHQLQIHIPHKGYINGSGASPSEVLAAAQLAGTASHAARVTRPDADPELAFAEGLAAADAELACEKIWSAAPTLFIRLIRDPRVRKLVGRTKSVSLREGLIDPSLFEAFDRQTGMALALLDTLPEKPGPMSEFLIRMGDDVVHDARARGWCGTSAILGQLVRNLYAGDITNDVVMWEVYPTEAECGLAARIAAYEFEPEAIPVR